MQGVNNSISACLVVFNEEAVIERCLKSLQGLVREIIVVHDGECSDKTLEIAKKYTDKIFVREHSGMMEAHLAYAFKQTTGDWILRIDADEYFDQGDFGVIREKIAEPGVGGLIFRWELWDGTKAVHFQGLQKMCLFKKEDFEFVGVPHENGNLRKLAVSKIDVVLHHEPVGSNISWSNFKKKCDRWIPVHAGYFFKDPDQIECFNCDAVSWVQKARNARKKIFLVLATEPLKMFLGQLKNGLWKSRNGFRTALGQFYYYFRLYLHVWQLEKRQK